MAYTVIEFRGNHYIKWEVTDKAPPNIGPYRYEIDARKAAEQLNTSAQKEAHERLGQAAV